MAGPGLPMPSRLWPGWPLFTSVCSATSHLHLALHPPWSIVAMQYPFLVLIFPFNGSTFQHYSTLSVSRILSKVELKLTQGHISTVNQSIAAIRHNKNYVPWILEVLVIDSLV